MTANLFKACAAWAETRCSERCRLRLCSVCTPLRLRPRTPLWTTGQPPPGQLSGRWSSKNHVSPPWVLEGSPLKHAGSRGLSTKSSGNLSDLYLGADGELTSLGRRAMEGSFGLCLCLWAGVIGRGLQIGSGRAESSFNPARHQSVEHE